ncbi:DUF1496 domain-containing protein [Vibrio sp. Hep-1b-8]|uniref:DUF1496 domain-containing protein n=1 Tax=Vibrio sp. Hep-1b-8 TaxID=2144187 RepID=UPI00111031F1|nr:DUF1496 domain-containing protein [Vibrio sp. Hep-1b-8]TMX47351.1 DUF1496 domain-containing protein [Vibrio sp. Hep-1b-8]
MKSYLPLLLVVMPFSAQANTISTTAKPIIAVNAGEIGKRVCYYQDQAYSDGAILQVGEHYMICSAANDFETNGALKWSPLAEHSESSTSKEKPKAKAVKRYSTNE